MMKNLSTAQIIEMLLAGADAVIKSKEKINAINVFPVPDSDTGSNLAKTLGELKNVVKSKSNKNLEDLTNLILNTVLICSQGNSGIMMTAYLSGFLSSLKEKNTLGNLSNGFKKGAAKARESVENPKSGTMLDVMDAFAICCVENSSIEKALDITRQALVRTESKMKVLSDSHVVDAGALGFTIFIYAFYGREFDFSGMDMVPREKKTKQSFEFVYEVIFIVGNTKFNTHDIKDMFHPLGDSLDIINIGNKIKVHIHTNEPKLVVDTAYLLGEIDTINEVDMRIESAKHV